MTTYNITFNPMGKTCSVDPGDFPLSSEGESGSLLDIAEGNGIDIPHACGGVGACGTCHVIVNDSDGHNLSECDDDELDMIDQVPAATLNSRLACLAIVKGDVTVTIPNWNRNLVSE